VPTENETKPMNNDTQLKQAINQIPDATKDAVAAAKNAYDSISQKVDLGLDRTQQHAQNAIDAAKDAAHRASDATKDIYQTASARAEDALVSSKEYARDHPLPVALGAFITGIAIGCMIGMAQREEPTFRSRFF
jgi:ElaB/YqjD/DUF883 family membrane-anchored ribosome-binding protein